MPEWVSQDKLQAFWGQGLDVLRRLPQARVRQVLYAVILLGFVSMLADIFWMLMPMPAGGQLDNNLGRLEGSIRQASRHAGTPASDSQPAVNVTSIKAWNLFGAARVDDNLEVDPTAGKPEVDTDTLPVSRLQLKLLGVMQNSNNPDLSHAIIADASNTDVYVVGDELPVGRNVTLARVLREEVVIDNRGKYETLKLYDEDEKGAGRVTSARRPVTVEREPEEKRVIDHSRNERLAEVAENYRQQLLRNPMSLADVIKVSVAKDDQGKLMGYRIRPGRDRQQFTDFGLQSGDIVTSINGVNLDDPAKAMQLYGDLRTATEATFVVLRGNEEINLIVGLSGQ